MKSQINKNRRLRFAILSTISSAVITAPITGSTADPTDPTNFVVINNINSTNLYTVGASPTASLIDGLMTNNQFDNNTVNSSQDSSSIFGNPVQGGTTSIGGNVLSTSVGANSANNALNLSMLTSFANATQGVNSSQIYLGTITNGTALSFATTNSNALISINLNGVGDNTSVISTNAISSSATINNATTLFTGSLASNYTPPIVAQPGISQSTTRDSAHNNVITMQTNGLYGGITANNTQVSDNAGYTATGANASNLNAQILISKSNVGSISAGQQVSNNNIISTFDANSETTAISPTLGANALSSTVELANSQSNVASAGMVGGSFSTEKASTSNAVIGIDLPDGDGTKTSNDINTTTPITVKSNAITAAVVGNSAVGMDANGYSSAGNSINIDGTINAASTAGGTATATAPGAGSSTVGATVGLANAQITQGTNLISAVSGFIKSAVDHVFNSIVSTFSNQLSASTKANDANNQIQINSATTVSGSIVQSNNQNTDLSAVTANSNTAQSLTATTTGGIAIQAGRLQSGNLNTSTLTLSNNTAMANVTGNSAVNSTVINADIINAPQPATVPLASGTVSNATGTRISANANSIVANDQEITTNGGNSTAILTATNSAIATVQLLDSITTVTAPAVAGSASRSTSAIGLTGSTVTVQGNQTLSEVTANSATNNFEFTGSLGSSAAIDSSQIVGRGTVAANTNGTASASITGLQALNSIINVNSNVSTALANGNNATNGLSQVTNNFTYNNPSSSTPAANIPQSTGADTIKIDSLGDNTLSNSGALNSVLNNQFSTASYTAALSGNYNLIALGPVTVTDATGHTIDDAHGSQSAGQTNGSSLAVTSNSEIATSVVNNASNTLSLGSPKSPIQTLLPAASPTDQSIDHQSAALIENAQSSTGATQTATINGSTLGIQIVAEDSATQSALATSVMTVSNNAFTTNVVGNQATNTLTINASNLNGSLISDQSNFWANSITSAINHSTNFTLGGAGVNHNEQIPLGLVDSQYDTTLTRSTTVSDANIEVTNGVNPNSSNAALGVIQTVSANSFTLDSNSIAGTSYNNSATNQLSVSAINNMSGGALVSGQMSSANAAVSVTGSIQLITTGQSTNIAQSNTNNLITVTNNSIIGRNVGNLTSDSVTLSGENIGTSHPNGASQFPNT